MSDKGDTSKKPTKFVKARPKTLMGEKGGEPPTWAIATIVGIVGFIIVMSMLGQWDEDSFLRSILPFGKSDYFWVGVVAAPVVAMIGLMIGVKVWELEKSKSWPSTTGRIVKSKLEVQRHQFAGEPETIKNVPSVEYEFNVGSTKVHGRRIGIGDDAGGENLEATLKRYPVGTIVTVYYDPKDPTHCVLERSGPAGITARGCLGALAQLVAFGAAVYVFIAYGPAFIAAQFPKSEPLIVMCATGFSFVLLMFFIAARRRSKQAFNWPFVGGTIIKSAVEEFRERNSDDRVHTSYRAAVEYAYTVRGLDYVGTEVKLGLVVSGSRGIAEKIVAKYPEGAAVEVHYDPNNPATSALENPTGATWIIFIMSLLCFAFAVWQLGIFK